MTPTDKAATAEEMQNLLDIAYLNVAALVDSDPHAYSVFTQVFEYIRTLEAEHRMIREAIEKEMPTEHLVLCDVNEFANADISGCVCPIKTFRKVLSSLTPRP